MKRKNIFTFLILLFTIHCTTAQNNPLQLKIVQKESRNSGLKDTKYFDFIVKNVSNQPVTVIAPDQTEPHWGGYKSFWFVSVDNQVAPPVKSDYPMPSKSIKNKGLVVLKPGDSITVNRGSVETPKSGLYKIYGVFVQDPTSLIEEYRKKLGNKVNELQEYELHSDTLTFDYTPSCKPLGKELNYKDLSVVRPFGTSGTTEDYPLYSFGRYVWSFSADFTHLVRLEITPKDNLEEIVPNIPYFKNLRELNLTLDSGQPIPDFVKGLTGLISLTIIVNDNRQKKEPLKGVDELASLSALQHLKLSNTFIGKCPEWIKKSTSLRSLIFLDAFLENPQLSKIPNLEALAVLLVKDDRPGVLDFANVVKLKELVLYNGEYEFPKNFLSKLKELKKLKVNASKIDFVPELAGLNNLEDLNITLFDELANHYPIGLGTLVQLKKLQLTGCFNNIDFPNMSACKNLESVDMTDRSMTKVPAELEALQARLPQLILRAPKLDK